MILKLDWSQNGPNTELIMSRDKYDMLGEQLMNSIYRAFALLNHNLVFERATQKFISANKSSDGIVQMKVRWTLDEK